MDRIVFAIRASPVFTPSHMACSVYQNHANLWQKQGFSLGNWVYLSYLAVQHSIIHSPFQRIRYACFLWHSIFWSFLKYDLNTRFPVWDGVQTGEARERENCKNNSEIIWFFESNSTGQITFFRLFHNVLHAFVSKIATLGRKKKVFSRRFFF